MIASNDTRLKAHGRIFSCIRLRSSNNTKECRIPKGFVVYPIGRMVSERRGDPPVATS